MDSKRTVDSEEAQIAARRRFLANCGKFALVTPPVVSLMLSASKRSYANAGSCNMSDRFGGEHNREENRVA